jgi:hypothetical protein
VGESNEARVRLAYGAHSQNILERKFRRKKSRVRSQCSWEHVLKKGFGNRKILYKIFQPAQDRLVLSDFLIVYGKSVSNSRKMALTD